MNKSSINFKAVKSNSESHNTRVAKLNYTYAALTKNNESWSIESVSSRLANIQTSCKKKSGRKLQKNATPIREAVVNLLPETSMDDLKNLTLQLEEQFKINAFQIHIHRDEGKSADQINYHAHILFDFQDKVKGSMLRLNKLDMSKIQTLTAEALRMQRGELGSKAVRLEAQAYKQTKEIEALSQKKSALVGLPGVGLNTQETNTLMTLIPQTQTLRKKARTVKKELESNEKKLVILQNQSQNNRQKLQLLNQKLMQLQQPDEIETETLESAIVNAPTPQSPAPSPLVPRM